LSKKQFGDYYLGLDIGTDSVGWAVTDREYNILNFNGKAMWGIHLFDSGKTAESRRTQRIARRRNERRKQRIDLLQELFSSEISKVDFTFFERLDESRLVQDDRKNKHHDTLFNDPNFKDRDLHKKFPTIYHLRQHLIDTKETPDIRFLYLACHHIVKYRGHFLFEGLSGDVMPEFGDIFKEAIECFNSECGTEIQYTVFVDVKGTLENRDLGVREKSKKISEILQDEENPDAVGAFSTLISGGTANLEKLFGEELKGEKLTFKNTDFEEERSKLEDKIDEDKMLLLERSKTIYDNVVLSRLIGEHKSISRAKIAQYDQHKKDLRLLKAIVKNNKPLYDDIFKSDATKDNYSSYVGVHKRGTVPVGSCTQSEFCKYLRKVLKDILEDTMFSSGEWADMKKRIEEESFMPKQVSKDNSMIPNALHKAELVKILDNASSHYPFLNDKDADGYTVKKKIVDLCTFRIPYYVGPLNSRSEKSWFVRKEEGKITPWNFESKVDLDESAEKFIGNLINKCTYIPTENVIPKCSLLYSRFELYNELNNLQINGERVDLEVKNKIISGLFENPKSNKRVKAKDIEEFLFQNGLFHKDDEISKVDIEIKSSLKSENQIKQILDIKKNRDIAEDVIRVITVFGDDRSRVKKKLYSDYKDRLSDEQIDKLSKLRFTEWGRLSKKFLLGVYATVDGREMNILTALEQTNLNLMQLLSNDYGFTKEIEKIRGLESTDGKISYDLLDDLYVSPPVKRGIWRSLKIVEDILKVTGHPPAKVFVETTREHQDKKRTTSRKDKLIELYKACKDQDDMLKEIEGTEEGRFRSKDLYAYYTQQGRCMYCGRKIDLNDLFSNKMYDLDHIHPRSKKDDDSIHNNMVLVCREHNQEKGDTYPLPQEWQNNMRGFWGMLKSQEFITKEKYDRLTRTNQFTEDELAGFINRQLVETSQTVKAVTGIMKILFGEKSDVVYVKANTVSDFRNGNNGYKDPNSEESLKFIKCRSVNDYHHAKDAYLNIVVGNAYDVKFTKDFKSFVKSGENWTLNLDKMLSRDIERNGVRAWTAGNDGTIATVSKYMRRNNILFTRFQYEVKGQLFDLNPLKKGNGQLPLKKGLDIEKYGGYNRVAGSYYMLVEHTVKGKRVRTIQSVPVHVSMFDERSILDYVRVEGALVDPIIRIPKIRKYSMFEIDGFRLHISGRTGDRILYYGAEQLILTDDDYDYCKKVYNHITKQKEARRSLPAKDSGLTGEDNVRIYDVLQNKYGGKKYKVFFNGLSETLIEKREKFINLSLEDQSEVLNELLYGFQCNPVYVNLKKIEGPGTIGDIKKNKDISRLESVKIINQSTSGLFESWVDLKKI
jgi:CRISPR-associated endonuclease Csn1